MLKDNFIIHSWHNIPATSYLLNTAFILLSDPTISNVNYEQEFLILNMNVYYVWDSHQNKLKEGERHKNNF